jgi:hypothetical protein
MRTPSIIGSVHRSPVFCRYLSAATGVSTRSRCCSTRFHRRSSPANAMSRLTGASDAAHISAAKATTRFSYDPYATQPACPTPKHGESDDGITHVPVRNGPVANISP